MSNNVPSKVELTDIGGTDCSQHNVIKYIAQRHIVTCAAWPPIDSLIVCLKQNLELLGTAKGKTQ